MSSAKWICASELWRSWGLETNWACSIFKQIIVSLWFWKWTDKLKIKPETWEDEHCLAKEKEMLWATRQSKEPGSVAHRSRDAASWGRGIWKQSSWGGDKKYDLVSVSRIWPYEGHGQNPRSSWGHRAHRVADTVLEVLMVLAGHTVWLIWYWRRRWSCLAFSSHHFFSAGPLNVKHFIMY